MFPEGNLLLAVFVEQHGSVNVVVIVVEHSVNLSWSDRLVEVELQFLYRVHAHIEFEQFEAGALGLVIEVVDPHQVNLRDEPVTVPYLVGPVIELRVDDLHGFTVERGIVDDAVQLHDHVNHRVVIAEVIEPDKPTIRVPDLMQKHV